MKTFIIDRSNIQQTLETRTLPQPKATHTPAPWQFETPSTVLIPVYNDKAGAEPIRLMLQTKAGEAKANARLIAAAPELLEALTSLFEQCAMIHKYGGSADNTREADTAIAAARAAIQKARG